MTRTTPTAATDRTGGPDVVLLRQRLRRVAGQVLGIERVIADGRPCGDVLVQLAAAQGALRAAAHQALTRHAHMLTTAVAAGTTTPGDAADEFAHLTALHTHAAAGPPTGPARSGARR